MKTFEQIVKKMFDEHYKSPEGWPDNISVAQLHNDAAKEYAKQWVDEAADIAMLQAEKGLPVGDAIYELKNQIDKQ